MVENTIEQLLGSPSFLASLETVKTTILPFIIRYEAVPGNDGKVETVAEHVDDMERVEEKMLRGRPALQREINRNRTRAMRVLHDSGEPEEDLSQGNPNYDALRSQYDEIEAQNKIRRVFPLFREGQERDLAIAIDAGFERRHELNDRDGHATRVADKGQPLDKELQTGIITNSTRKSWEDAGRPGSFDDHLRQDMHASFRRFTDPARDLHQTLSPAAQQELLFFVDEHLAPFVERGFHREVQTAKSQAFGRRGKL